MKCRGIEITPGVYSGCDVSGGATDCPTCGGNGDEQPSNDTLHNALLSAAAKRSREVPDDRDELVDLLIDARTRLRDMRDALCWCSGCPAFAPGGEAEEGWKKIAHLIT